MVVVVVVTAMEVVVESEVTTCRIQSYLTCSRRPAAGTAPSVSCSTACRDPFNGPPRWPSG